jgi:hypothetical protein
MRALILQPGPFLALLRSAGVLDPGPVREANRTYRKSRVTSHLCQKETSSLLRLRSAASQATASASIIVCRSSHVAVLAPLSLIAGNVYSRWHKKGASTRPEDEQWEELHETP